MAARSKTWVCGRSLAEILVSNPSGWHGCLSLVCVVCCQVEGSASAWSLFQRSPTDCGVSECDHGSSIMRRSLPTRGCCGMVKKNSLKAMCWLKKSLGKSGNIRRWTVPEIIPPHPRTGSVSQVTHMVEGLCMNESVLTAEESWNPS